LNVRTFLADISHSAPVWGFRPLRAFLLLTTKLPKLDILTVSPWTAGPS
jgi:hypothetical protein